MMSHGPNHHVQGDVDDPLFLFRGTQLPKGGGSLLALLVLLPGLLAKQGDVGPSAALALARKARPAACLLACLLVSLLAVQPTSRRAVGWLAG